MADWYVSIDGDEMGPYSMDVLRQLADQKQLGPENLVWKDGMPDWVTASEIGELKGYGDISRMKIKSTARPPAPPQNSFAANYGAPAPQMQTPNPNYLVQGAVDRGYQQEKPTGEPPVSVGDWFLTLLIMTIPIVNLVLLFIWALDTNTNESKRNWAKAALWWILVAIFLYTLAALIFGIAFIELLSAAQESGTEW